MHISSERIYVMRRELFALTSQVHDAVMPQRARNVDDSLNTE